MTVTSRAKKTCTASRTPVTQTLKGNEKQFELGKNLSYQGKFQWNFDWGKANLVELAGNSSYLSLSYQGSSVYRPVLWASSSLILLAEGHFLLILMILLEDNLPGCMPIGQVSFNPFNPKIKIWILICHPYSFLTKVVGRSW